MKPHLYPHFCRSFLEILVFSYSYSAHWAVLVLVLVLDATGSSSTSTSTILLSTSTIDAQKMWVRMRHETDGMADAMH